MKKIISYLIIILFSLPMPAYSLTVAWDQHTDASVLGYTLYWQEQGTTEEFRVDLPGISTTEYIIEDKFLKIDKTYDIWATAYSNQANSDKSEAITAIRRYAFSPPASNLPVITYDPQKPTKITINASP